MVVINETFASVAYEGDYVVLWHEAIAGQKAFEVASSNIKCINTSRKEHFKIWADNCTAQNRVKTGGFFSDVLVCKSTMGP